VAVVRGILIEIFQTQLNFTKDFHAYTHHAANFHSQLSLCTQACRAILRHFLRDAVDLAVESPAISAHSSEKAVKIVWDAIRFGCFFRFSSEKAVKIVWDAIRFGCFFRFMSGLVGHPTPFLHGMPCIWLRICPTFAFTLARKLSKSYGAPYDLLFLSAESAFCGGPLRKISTGHRRNCSKIPHISGSEQRESC
jgi:hypothetical protein